MLWTDLEKVQSVDFGSKMNKLSHSGHDKYFTPNHHFYPFLNACHQVQFCEKVVSQSWEYDDAHDNGWIDQQSFKSTYNSPNNQLTLILAATKALPSTETLGILTWRNIL